ncbi:SusD/RagB family nutrient-binding outer membrane lipoprotein [Mucilaginibacter sp. BT774]|uniref:SusD/RagB family nutrient-binding outer membrane lipoprotein n=1 Tax=Mucilaginibacter sp. BT774 TaxID=3062276 RepID=UPI002675A38E|nr:SusD/RagB family nutrient-binding outer membrane lipoprotein [Mucilaginibacter sp. BT774]MDO3628396.1 SusD/RagB family nutrient-binding outer membrane lipoprotein [Mucilaginibacter sp. BT774]
MKKIYICAITTLLVLGQMSCRKPNDFGNTNLDPGNTTKPIVPALITQVEANLGTYVSTNNLSQYGGEYAQYFTETQYPGISTYSLPQLSFTGYYSGDLFDLQNVINLNQDKNSVAVAKILQQFIFWEITDAWGDVPYSQALQGLKSITPVYDKQEDIYKGILATLASASASMDNGPIPGDIIYNGDVASWKKAANSLSMLVAIQLSKKVPGASDYAAAAFNAALAAGGITTNAENMAISYPGSAFKDPWWNLYNGRTDYAESKVVTDLTAGFSDGRTVPFGGDYTDPGQVTGGTVTSAIGIPPGLSRSDVTAFTTANPKWALVMRADKRTETSTVVIISAAEVFLARAEAADIGWTSETFASTYNVGIALSFDQWGLAAPAASYYTQNGVLLTAAPGTGGNEQPISIQRYLASYPDGHMAWDIWRKTGYPTLSPAPGATNPSGQIVRRFTYATSENQTNGANVKAAIARETGPAAGTDSQDNRVWWDVTP